MAYTGSRFTASCAANALMWRSATSDNANGSSVQASASASRKPKPSARRAGERIAGEGGEQQRHQWRERGQQHDAGAEFEARSPPAGRGGRRSAC